MRVAKIVRQVQTEKVKLALQSFHVTQFEACEGAVQRNKVAFIVCVAYHVWRLRVQERFAETAEDYSHADWHIF
jgi:hypothetical protein